MSWNNRSWVINGSNFTSAPSIVATPVPVPTLEADWTVSSTIPSELSFARASAGTYVDSAGIIQTAATGVPRFTYDAHTLQPEGLLLEPAATNSFSSGRRLQNWDTFGVGRTINTTATLAPDGTQTATRLTENTSNSEHVIYPNSTVLPAGSYPKNQRLGFSVFAKAGSRNILSVNLNQDAQNEYLTVWFYLATGETRLFSGSINAGLVHEINMEPFGNGWWRCSASFTLATSTANTPNLLRLNMTDGTLPNNWGTPAYLGNGSDIFLWGAQMEFGSKRVTSVILTDTATATRAADDLSVASTTGWYDDTAWTVLHDTEFKSIVNPSASLASGTWENSTAANTNDWLRVRWSKELGQFCAVADGPLGSGGSQFRVMTSSDGINWTQRAAAQSGGLNSNWHGLAWSPDLGLWVAVAYDGPQRVMTSYDGIDWTIRNAAENNTWVDVVWSPELSLFCAVSTNGTNRVMTSPDGVTWTARTPAVTTNQWRGIVWAKELGIFVAVGSDGGSSGQGAMTSPDGITWTARTSPVGATWASVTWSPELNLFVAVGYGSGTRFMTSPDGINWTARTGGNSGCLWRDVSWAPEIGKFVAVASSGAGINERVAISSDGINWTGITYAAPGSTITHTVDAASVLRSVAWSPELGVFAMVAATEGTVVTPIELRARTSTTTDEKREMLRYRSNAATDTWVTGSATGFLNSGIVDAKVARFAYYDKKLTAAELAALGV